MLPDNSFSRIQEYLLSAGGGGGGGGISDTRLAFDHDVTEEESEKLATSTNVATSDLLSAGGGGGGGFGRVSATRLAFCHDDALERDSEAFAGPPNVAFFVKWFDRRGFSDAFQ